MEFGRRVEALLATQGAISGCRGRGEADGVSFEEAADAVIVASGGINGSQELIRRHWHAAMAKLHASLQAQGLEP